jgi:hypothetical protein
MNSIKEEIGTVFYRLDYQGRMHEYTIIGNNNGECRYISISLTSFKDDIYRFERCAVEGKLSFPISVVNEKTEEYYDSLEDAKEISIKRFNKQINPNGNYRVARYFDDHFECFVTDILTKKEASNKRDTFKNGQYVSYDIMCVDNR